MTEASKFRLARDRLLALHDAPGRDREAFQWPRLTHFNWALDYFDPMARGNSRPALRVVEESGSESTLTFEALSRRSNQVANLFRSLGVGAGDRVLVMLGNVVPLWETMLALIKLRAVIVPSATLLQKNDLADRLQRGRIKAVIADAALAGRFEALPAVPVRIATGTPSPAGWTPYANVDGEAGEFDPGGPTPADELLLLYFTSGTTANPKLVAHTHQSYPIGHLSTMFWLGLRPGDVHLNLSSPGWAKHAWSCFFAPWNAGATVLAWQYQRFDAQALLDQLVRQEVTTFCAPPTVWRMLIQLDLARWPVKLREATSAGEPLNPEVIERVREAWGLTIRDGYGQTETTAQIGNPPGQPVKPGSMGRSLPGYRIALVASDGTVGDEGEICIDLASRPLGLMQGYLDDAERTDGVMRDGYYHTGDVAVRDSEGYITYVGRTDDVFKSSDYRISPFELESVLIEHPSVAEAAVVPSPDARRLTVPKAFIVLAAGVAPDAATALSIFEHVRDRVSPYKRIRRIEFSDLPKTISGKIRRVELRQLEMSRGEDLSRRPNEYWEEDCARRGESAAAG